MSTKIQTGGFNILDLMNPEESVYKIANKTEDLSNKVSLDEVIKTVNVFRKIMPDLNDFFRTEITLTKN